MILQQLIHVCSYYDSLFGERENKKKQLQAIIIILMGKLVLSNWISSVGSIDVSLKDCSCSRHPCILQIHWWSGLDKFEFSLFDGKNPFLINNSVNVH